MEIDHWCAGTEEVQASLDELLPIGPDTKTVDAKEVLMLSYLCPHCESYNIASPDLGRWQCVICDQIVLLNTVKE